MHHIEIKNLGPIEYCSMDVNNFMVFTGPQASGKSTIAKAVYLFRSVKGYIIDRAILKMTNKSNTDESLYRETMHYLIDTLNAMFDNTSGSELTYSYSGNEDASIWIGQVGDEIQKANISVFIRKQLDFIDRIVGENDSDYEELTSYISRIGFNTETKANKKELIEFILNDTFSDDSDCIYIPAGRSIITTLTDHLAYIFTSMDDRRKSSIDYCTRMYVEQVLKLKPVFSSAPHKLINKQNDIDHKELLRKASIHMQMVLNGYYLNKGSEESIVVDNEYSVKLNYASSGQQETVWLFNILFYYLMEQKNVFIVIEEPESHLFPEAQKSIVELIGLFSKQGQNQVLLTTHSPYILGAVNNLLFASQLDKAGKDVGGVFDKDMLISNDILSSYFIADGKATDCMDSELRLIEQSVIDGASEKINDDYERLFQLQDNNREDN